MKSTKWIISIFLIAAISVSANEGIIGASLRDENDGVYVNAVFDGFPARASGIKSGDIITYIDDAPVGNTDYFIRFIKQNPGRKIKISFTRNGNRFKTYLTIATKPDNNYNRSSGSLNNAGRRQYILTQIQILDSKIESQRRSISLYQQSGDYSATHMMLMNSANQLLNSYLEQRAQWERMLYQN